MRGPVLVLARACVVAIAACAVAAVLIARGDGDREDTARAGLRQVTAERGDLVLKLDGRGVLRSWGLTVYGRCDDGTADGMQWLPADDGAPARVVRRGDVVQAVEVRRGVDDDGSRSRVRLELRARMAPREATVRVAYSARRDRPSGRRVYCGTPPQTFRVPLVR